MSVTEKEWSYIISLPEYDLFPAKNGKLLVLKSEKEMMENCKVFTSKRAAEMEATEKANKNEWRVFPTMLEIIEA